MNEHELGELVRGEKEYTSGLLFLTGLSGAWGIAGGVSSFEWDFPFTLILFFGGGEVDGVGNPAALLAVLDVNVFLL